MGVERDLQADLHPQSRRDILPTCNQDVRLFHRGLLLVRKDDARLGLERVAWNQDYSRERIELPR